MEWPSEIIVTPEAPNEAKKQGNHYPLQDVVVVVKLEITY